MRHRISDSLQKRSERPLNTALLAAAVAAVQRTSGEIPWFRNGKTDPWDHVEAAMGLSVGGFLAEAARAYDWLASVQNADGSWFAEYRHGQPADCTRDVNFSVYLAVGVFHHYLITGDRSFLRRLWPAVDAAVDFATAMQSPHGEIYWAVSPAGKVDRMALLTGSSCVCMSLRCALAIAAVLDQRRSNWKRCLERLQHAVAAKPHRFNIAKSRYSMDWYYPVLGGVLTGAQARRRLEHHWKRFVIEGQGVRCVFDRPWVTIAETCELALALAACGERQLARIVFGWLADKRYEDGSFWAGYTYPDMTIWPAEKLTWTDGVVLLAADAVYGLTPAAELFFHRCWGRDEPVFSPCGQGSDNP